MLLEAVSERQDRIMLVGRVTISDFKKQLTPRSTLRDIPSKVLATDTVGHGFSRQLVVGDGL